MFLCLPDPHRFPVPAFLARSGEVLWAGLGSRSVQNKNQGCSYIFVTPREWSPNKQEIFWRFFSSARISCNIQQQLMTDFLAAVEI